MSRGRLGTHDFYKGHYILAFYDESDEYIRYVFDNCREIAQYIGRKTDRRTINELNVRIFRAIKYDSIVRFINNEKLRVHIIDMEDENE